MRPLILLSNDDGYSAPGLTAVRDELARHADVVVCAPAVNQSATSHSLSLHRVLRLLEAAPGVFAVDGTPADCIYVALHAGTRVLPRGAPIAVSGMNHGLNLGADIFYSGTVRRRPRRALRGVPSIALSADAGASLPAAAALGVKLASPSTAPPGRRDAGQRRCSMSTSLRAAAGPCEPRASARACTPKSVIFRRDPRGHEYLWIGGAGRTPRPRPRLGHRGLRRGSRQRHAADPRPLRRAARGHRRRLLAAELNDGHIAAT